MRRSTFLLASLMGLTVTACSNVLSVMPVGDEPVYLEPKQWEGLWVADQSEDETSDQPTVATFEVNVVDAAGGILEYSDYIDPKDCTKTVRAVVRQHTHEGSLDRFISAKSLEGDTKDYVWAKYRRLGNALILYLPDVDKFKELVNKGEMAGKVSSNFGTDVLLDPLSNDQLDRITTDKEHQMFDLEFKAATLGLFTGGEYGLFPGLYRVSPILVNGGICCTSRPNPGEGSNESTGRAPLRYTITDLGNSETTAMMTFPRYMPIEDGFTRTIDEQLAINNAGRVAGLVATHMKDGNLLTKAFVWAPISGVTELGMLDGYFIDPIAISDAGRVAGAGGVVGRSLIEDHAVFFDPSHGITDLGTLGGRWSYALSINDLGQIVGESETPNRQFHAFIWEGGVMSDLGALGGAYSSAQAINKNGQVVGSIFRSTDGDVRPHKAFLWTHGGGMADLGTLGGVDSEANAINEKGEVVGASKTVQGYQRAFVWHPGTGMVDLGTLGGRDSTANSINNAGQVVGWSEITWGDTKKRHAFLWDHGKMIDLSSLPEVKEAGWSSLTEVRGINDHGQIVGFGVRDNQLHPFLLTPIPPRANGG